MTKFDRRDFLKQAAGAMGAATQAGQWSARSEGQRSFDTNDCTSSLQGRGFPRKFEGGHLRMIAFPLGGVAAAA